MGDLRHRYSSRMLALAPQARFVLYSLQTAAARNTGSIVATRPTVRFTDTNGLCLVSTRRRPLREAHRPRPDRRAISSGWLSAFPSLNSRSRWCVGGHPTLHSPPPRGTRCRPSPNRHRVEKIVAVQRFERHVLVANVELHLSDQRLGLREHPVDFAIEPCSRLGLPEFQELTAHRVRRTLNHARHEVVHDLFSRLVELALQLLLHRFLVLLQIGHQGTKASGRERRRRGDVRQRDPLVL